MTNTRILQQFHSLLLQTLLLLLPSKHKTDGNLSLKVDGGALC